MSFPLPEKFKPGTPLRDMVTTEIMQTVVGILNHIVIEEVEGLTQPQILKTAQPGRDTPWRIQVPSASASTPDIELSDSAPPADGGSGSPGSSPLAARGDHSHPHSAKLIEVYDWCIEAEGRIQTAEDNDVSIYDWIDTHVQEENALFEAVNTDLNTLFQNDQTLQNNLTAIDQNVANLQDWANNMTTWAQNFDASLDQLFANDQTLYNNQNDLWAGLNSLDEWSNNVAAWSNNVSTDINTLFDAVNRIYYYWRGGYFG